MSETNIPDTFISRLAAFDRRLCRIEKMVKLIVQRRAAPPEDLAGIDEKIGALIAERRAEATASEAKS